MDSTHNLTSSEETGDGLAVGVENTRLGVHTKTTHSVVDNGSHESNVVVVVHDELLAVVEEFTTEGILLRGSNLAVVLEGLVKGGRRAANVLGEVLTSLEVLHETTASVVLAVPFDGRGSSTVEDKAEGALVLHHLLRDIVTTAELVAETVAITIEKDGASTAESLSSKELDLGIRLVGVDETSGVDLNGSHVLHVGTNGDSHLDTITSAVLTVGGGEVTNIRAVLHEEGVRGEVSTIATRGDDNNTLLLEGLAVLGVHNTVNSTVGVGEKTGSTSLREHTGAVGLLEL
jgi:hypothetical protein